MAIVAIVLPEEPPRQERNDTLGEPFKSSRDAGLGSEELMQGVAKINARSETAVRTRTFEDHGDVPNNRDLPVSSCRV